MWNLNRKRNRVQYWDSLLFIAPMWNLNTLVDEMYGIGYTLFIAPMWNLNYLTGDMELTESLAFYCTYVEFKRFSRKGLGEGLDCFLLHLCGI